ncbi:MAG TPA: hypothetical protein PKE00_14870 [Planctomycetota bacterium]|nr:hypothetical protein [Planctomycetota bacterium]
MVVSAEDLGLDVDGVVDGVVDGGISPPSEQSLDAGAHDGRNLTYLCASHPFVDVASPACQVQLEPLERRVDADGVAELEAVGDGLGRAVDVDLGPIDLVPFDSGAERLATESKHAKRWPFADHEGCDDREPRGQTIPSTVSQCFRKGDLAVAASR